MQIENIIDLLLIADFQQHHQNRCENKNFFAVSA